MGGEELNEIPPTPHRHPCRWLLGFRDNTPIFPENKITPIIVIIVQSLCLKPQCQACHDRENAKPLEDAEVCVPPQSQFNCDWQHLQVSSSDFHTNEAVHVLISASPPGEQWRSRSLWHSDRKEPSQHGAVRCQKSLGFRDLVWASRVTACLQVALTMGGKG